MYGKSTVPLRQNGCQADRDNPGSTPRLANIKTLFIQPWVATYGKHRTQENNIFLCDCWLQALWLYLLSLTSASKGPMKFELNNPRWQIFYYLWKKLKSVSGKGFGVLEYRLQGGGLEGVKDSHNLWSYSCLVWAILCSFPLHCFSCKLTVSTQWEHGCISRETRPKQLWVHGKHLSHKI